MPTMSDQPTSAEGQTWADRAASTMRAVDDERRSAPAWRATPIDRFLARLIDFWVLSFAAAAIIVAGLALGFIEDDTTPENNHGVPSTVTEEPDRDGIAWAPRAPTVEGLLALGAGVGVLVAYEVGLTLLAGGTPGKRAMKLRVVESETRLPAGVRGLLVRAIAFTVPVVFAIAMWWTSIFLSWAALLLCAWLVWPVFAPGADGQARYDRLARTAVAKRGAAGA